MWLPQLADLQFVGALPPKHGVDDILIAGAAAQVAVQGLAHLRLGWVRHVIEQRLSREDHPGGTEAALQRVPLMERLLKGRQTRGISQTFDRRDGMAVRLHCQHRAGFDRSSV